jgi:HSP20 family protein
MYAECNTAGYGHAYERRMRGHHGFMGGHRRAKYNVPVNINEQPGSFEVWVYATGFDKENIKISVSGDVLYITGTRQLAGDEPNFTSQEFPVKSFERKLGLNEKVDVDAITARQENGVLIVSLPKSKEAQQPARDIKVD